MKKIMFCGGGSAGHVIPNIAICEDLSSDFELSYIGTDSIEKSICANANLPFHTFNGVKLVRGKLLCNLDIPRKLYKSYRECLKILEKEKPDLLFCKGGYASLPPALAAAKLKIPVLTHESDISCGLANKIIARKAEKILTSFPQTSKKFKNGVYVGPPILKRIMNNDRLAAKKKFGLDLRPTVLVFGGGSGSRLINDCVRKSLIDLCKNYNVVHICGKGNVVENNIYGYIQLEFCNDMGTVYACADYAVARCGSNSAFELIAMKIPTLFIPLQNGASRGDQIENAKYFENLGLCHVLKEADMTCPRLIEEINYLIRDNKIKTALKNYNSECGNELIEQEINAVMRR